jgi:HEAT repeat protein
MSEQEKLDQLVKQFESGSVIQKQRIFMKILEYPFEDIQDILFDSLRDNNHRIRSTAAKMLGKMGDQTVVPRILHFLSDDSWVVRSSAQETLSFLPPDIAIPAFRGILSSEIGDPVLRKNLSLVISKYNHPDAEKLLVNMYESAEDPSVKASLVESLGKYSSEEVLDVLFVALSDENWNVRKNAIRAMCNQKIEAVLELSIKALSNPARLIQMAAIEILIKLNGDKIVDAMAEVMEQDRILARVNAVNVLAGINTQESLALVVSALSDQNSTVRSRAIETLAQVPGNEALNLLKRCVNSSSWNVKLGTIRTLGLIASEEAVDLLETLLEEDNISVRIAVLEELANIGDRRSLRLLTEYISLPELGEDAIRIINILDPDQAIVHLVSFLTDDEFFDKTLDALRRLDPLKIQRYLASRISNGTPGEQICAVKSMSRLGSRETEQFLEPLLTGNISAELRQEIETAIRYLRRKLK